jgi:hypothetical protein
MNLHWTGEKRAQKNLGGVYKCEDGFGGTK